MLLMSTSDRSAVPAAGAFWLTWRGRLLLALATVAMLSLAYAPLKQFYFAWVGLVPWLVMVARAKSKKQAFFWSWLTGILFFSVNLWWIGYVTIPGAIALMFYMGLWFALVALVLRGARLLPTKTDGPAKPQAAAWAVLSMFLIAAVWVATEWTWGNLFTGLPWLYLGHTQTPILPMCQIADVTSAYGVSFWVVLVNVWVTLLILNRANLARLIVPGIVLLAVLGATLAYGLFRMGQRSTYPGPKVLVVQPNYPQNNNGSKGATYDEIVDFHFKTTAAALDALAAKGESAHLVVWSETMMPELNEVYRQYMHEFVTRDDKRNVGQTLDAIYDQLGSFSRAYSTNLLVGGHTMLPERPVNGKPTWARRNSAYLFDRSGHEAAQRYDKIHLVPFGEFIPFRESFPPLYKFFNLFNPYKGEDYTVQAGTDLTVFRLEPGVTRFVSAICFEDVDSTLMARNFAGPNGSKRADFIVNLTNDGWFATPQMQQHLQLSIFRCIENRVPTARSVNTGVSGFIDSVGRAHDLIPVHTTGTRVARLELDFRVAPYTHLGDVFAYTCVAAAAGTILLGVWNGMKNRRARGR
jgi:apolipoprotein N-acyltransferase